jgi:hypothetical protein
MLDYIEDICSLLIGEDTSLTILPLLALAP